MAGTGGENAIKTHQRQDPGSLTEILFDQLGCTWINREMILS